MTGTVTVEESAFGGVCRIKWSWTSTAGGAAALATAAGYYGRVISFLSDPGATAPTDNYDAVVTDADGYDVLQGAGVDRDTVNTEQGVPPAASVAFGPLTLTIANAGNAKNGVFVLLIEGVKIGG